jgi:thiamine-monophosphate kinase
MEPHQRTEISELGEFALIQRLTANNETVQASTMLSVGDDAAVIDHFGRQTVISTDLLLEGVHFDLTYTPLHHLGYKAVVVNLSDICAMFATPTHITVSVGISNKFSVEAMDAFYDGVYAACEKYGVDLVGGDTTTSLRGFVISVTAIGEVAPDKYVTRSGARPNDLLCVSGNLGAAYLGLQLLEREKSVFLETKQAQPQFEGMQYPLKRMLKPEPRTDIVDWLQANEITPTSMIDVSDGLSSEILHLCKASNTGCVLHENKIPIHDDTRQLGMQFNIPTTTCALSGGEDYELLFTIKQEDYDKLIQHNDLSVIGYITELETGAYMETPSGKKYELVAQGWSAFTE